MQTDHPGPLEPTCLNIRACSPLLVKLYQSIATSNGPWGLFGLVRTMQAALLVSVSVLGSSPAAVALPLWGYITEDRLKQSLTDYFC